jgi:hypothetical protein
LIGQARRCIVMVPRRAFCFWKAAFLHAVSLTKPCYHCKFIIFPELGEERALAWIKNVKRCRFRGLLQFLVMLLGWILQKM